jgi:hypothetical protein
VTHGEKVVEALEAWQRAQRLGYDRAFQERMARAALVEAIDAALLHEHELPLELQRF